MGKSKKKVISFFLVMSILSGLLLGCTVSKASAKVNERLELAVKYLSEQKYEEAILAYQEVIKIDSKNVIVYKGLSLAYQLDNKMDLADKTLDDGLKAVAQTPQLKLAMAGLMLDQGKADKAEDIYKELMYSDSPTLSTYQAYIYYLNKQGRAAEAIVILEQALAKNGEEYKLNSMLAELYYKNGNNEKALSAINRSMAEQIDQSASYKLLAEMYKDKWADLIALGEQYIQQSQTKTGQLLKLSGLLDMGKYGDVIKLYGELTTDLKDNIRARYITAQAYKKLGQKDQSIELMKPFKVADLIDAEMLGELANYYLEAGDNDNARKIALQGITVDNTAKENYAVMFKSYTGGDKNLAQIWALKYLLANFLSYYDGLSQLADYGLELSFIKKTKGELTSKEIVEKIVVDQAFAEKKLNINPNWRQLNSDAYLDTKNNIVYRGECKKASNWKPIIIRYHSPELCSKENIPTKIMEDMSRNKEVNLEYLNKFQKYLLLTSEDFVWPVVIEDNTPLEEHIKRAGYPIENITFIDM